MSKQTEEIHKVIAEKLIDVPKLVKDKFPEVLKQERLNWATFNDEKYFIIVFLAKDEEKRIKKLTQNNLHPFPGLITTEEKIPSAFRFQNSYNIYLEGNTVNNAYTISLGTDCTISLVNHTQSINVKELQGVYNFRVNLAFIISFGQEITKSNYGEFLREIISYSIKQWRRKDVH